MSSKLTSRLWQAGLLALGLFVACGGSTSRHEPDASPQSYTGGTKSNPTPTGGAKAATGGAAVPTRGGGSSEGGAPAAGGAVDSGGMAEAGAAPMVMSGGTETSPGGASGSGGTRASGGTAGTAGAGSGGSAIPTSGGAGGAGSVSSGGAGAASSGGGAGGAGPVHDRCADPLQLEFVNGEATVSDNTSRASDEFPTLTCAGAPEQGFPGGQIYYRFRARAGREYALRVKAPFFATVVFYVVPAATPCAMESIRAACSSHGVTGTANAASTALTPFAPPEPGDYIVGVDTGLTIGAQFTLTVLEYCGSSGGTDCKVKGCDLNLGKTCLGNTLSACNDDGTATVTTDCTMTGKSCYRGACVASVLDNIGYAGWTTSPAMSAGAAGVTLLDFFEVTTSRTITQLEIFMVQPRVFPLDWRILESTDRAGPYQTIFTTRTMSAGAMVTSSETTGPIQVPILAGRFYAIGVALPADARYYLQQQAEKSLPLDVSFGRLTSAAVVQSASSSTTIGYPAPGAFLIAQRITTEL